MSLDIYDKNGTEISMEEWATLSSDWDYKCVAENFLNGYRVSTVWLGLDHGWFEEGLRIFETMIFIDGQWDEKYCDRYATEEEASFGHQKAVAFAATLPPVAQEEED